MEFALSIKLSSFIWLQSTLMLEHQNGSYSYFCCSGTWLKRSLRRWGGGRRGGVLHGEGRSRSALWWEHGPSRRRRRSETLPGGSIPRDVPRWGGHAPWHPCQNQVDVPSCCSSLQMPPHVFNFFFMSFAPRFQRYRGLKSFRTSPWDPMENLPHDYSRIFQFQSFERTRRRILAEAAAEEEGALVKRDAVFIYSWTLTGYLNLCSFQGGWYVTLHIINVPFSVMESVQSGKPLVVVSLLPHEQKVQVHKSHKRQCATDWRFYPFHRCRWCTFWCKDILATPSRSNPKRNLCSTADSGGFGPPRYSLSTHQVGHLSQSVTRFI